ncbi:MAG: hypothetical protein J5855_00595 [Mailhella sp.]|nr:hypothetical protein [Mailhella sp.]
MTAGGRDLTEDAPKVPLIPVSMRIRTEKPEAGWWLWSIEFLEEGYAGHSIQPWKECGRERRRFQTKVSCSYVFDPVPDLDRFIWSIKGDSPCCELEIDEEGHVLTMQAWNLDAVKIQLRIFSLLRDEDFSWDFVLDRDAFIAELHAAYCSFACQGGWGADWGDRAIEDGSRVEVQIDTGDGISIDKGCPAWPNGIKPKSDA